jgi:hypothetical protein
MQQQHASGILCMMAANVSLLFIIYYLSFICYLVPAAAACVRRPAAA